MDVTTTAFRANLADWIDLARSGEEIVITERGAPVVRLVGLGTADTIERLTNEGLISRPKAPTRPRAAGRRRPRAHGSISDLVAEQRR